MFCLGYWEVPSLGGMTGSAVTAVDVRWGNIIRNGRGSVRGGHCRRAGHEAGGFIFSFCFGFLFRLCVAITFVSHFGFILVPILVQFWCYFCLCFWLYFLDTFFHIILKAFSLSLASFWFPKLIPETPGREKVDPRFWTTLQWKPLSFTFEGARGLPKSFPEPL